jgi:hypothetical protein
VNIPHQFQKVDLFLAENGFVSVLVEIPHPPVSTVKIHGIARQQRSHEGVQGFLATTDHEMQVIVHECPSITEAIGLFETSGETGKKFPAIFLIPKNGLSVQSASDDMVDGSRNV